MNTKQIPSLLEPDFLLFNANGVFITVIFVLVVSMTLIFFYFLPRIKQVISIYGLLVRYKKKSDSEKIIMYELTYTIGGNSFPDSPVFNEDELHLINRIKYDNFVVDDKKIIVKLLKKAIRIRLFGVFQ